MRLPRRLVLFALLALLLGMPARAGQDATAEKEAVARLPEAHRAWLEEVGILLTPEEKAAFLALDKDYQRDAFIRAFWAERDPDKRTGRNELRERWEARVAEARQRWGSLTGDGRARIYLLNGPPAATVISQCNLLRPVEAWWYNGSDRARAEFVVVFFRKWGAGPFRIWLPEDGLGELFNDLAQPEERNLQAVFQGCKDGDQLVSMIGWVLGQGQEYWKVRERIDTAPPPPGREWVATFESYSTELPAGAATFEARLAVAFPGRDRGRTVVQGVLAVPAAEAGQVRLAGHRSYNFALTGEVLHEGELFESFRYRFDLPASEVPAEGADAEIPLVFQRSLRPGDYTLVVKLEDLNSGRLFRAELPLSVPKVEGTARVAAPPADPESARLLAEAEAALASGVASVQIVPPAGGVQTGMIRFDTLVTGAGIARVTFALDGKPVLTKGKPPWSVELDLGTQPRPRTLSATAYDEEGEELAADELAVNAPAHRFAVRLLEPRKGKRYGRSLLAAAEVDAPEGQTVERVEIFLDETLVATLYQPPWTQPVVLGKSEIAYVRAVAYLPDGNSTEDLVFVNNPDIEEVEVDLVELYATVADRKGRPVAGLAREDFTAFEDGVRQEVVRFERVTDLPIHAAVALDVSASMAGSLTEARAAALRFFEQSVRPKDRAALIAFNDHPTLAARFTNDVTALAGGLAGLKAERGTALWDSVIFTLFYFNGVKGQRALLLLSDGKDEGSRFRYEEALETARRAGVTIYAVGLGEEVDKRKLTRLAEETGGCSFFVAGAAELGPVYAAIEEDLRSQYLVVYQSSNTSGGKDFRTVELKVARPGLEVTTMRGYYP